MFLKIHYKNINISKQKIFLLGFCFFRKFFFERKRKTLLFETISQWSKISAKFSIWLKMELVHGILRGLSSLKEGSLERLVVQLDPLEWIQVPKGTSPGTVKLTLTAQYMGQEYVITLEEVEGLVKAPCSTCSHKLEKVVRFGPEHLAFESHEVVSGQLDLRSYLVDLMAFLFPDSLACEEPGSCSLREDLDRQIAKHEKERKEHAYNPFKALLSNRNRKSS